jgi:hypothetical protein
MRLSLVAMASPAPPARLRLTPEQIMKIVVKRAIDNMDSLINRSIFGREISTRSAYVPYPPTMPPIELPEATTNYTPIIFTEMYAAYPRQKFSVLFGLGSFTGNEQSAFSAEFPEFLDILDADEVG